MNEKELCELLEQVRAGRLSVDAAAGRLEQAPLADLGYAQVDLHRRDRCGFPEVIFCEGTNREWIEGVVRKLVDAGQECLATRDHADVSTSIGYGAAFQGVAHLLTMLNSCSANVVVVNIDNGFKGGYVAALIARRRSG